MFEKEAKERARTLEERQTLGVYDDDESYARDLGWNEGEVAGYEEGFKDGAEFGYNKAMNEIGNRMESAYREGVAFGKDMANEWHYASKGEYPKECENVLCYCKVVNVEFYSIGHIIIGGDNKIRWWSSNRREELNVIAWKEIELPKEIKEND